MGLGFNWSRCKDESEPVFTHDRFAMSNMIRMRWVAEIAKTRYLFALAESVSWAVLALHSTPVAVPAVKVRNRGTPPESVQLNDHEHNWLVKNVPEHPTVGLAVAPTPHAIKKAGA